MANSSVHFLPATCHKVKGKLRQLARRNLGIPFVFPDSFDVMSHGGDMVTKRIFFSFWGDIASVGCHAK